MPADNQSLLDFIAAVKSQGASDEFVVALLRQNGWSERRIYQAFGAWYQERSGAAIPNGGGRVEAAKDAFLYLLAFMTLGIWTIQLGSLLFTSIDRTLPNPAMDYADSASITRSLANALAAIIVAFPLFLAVTIGIVRAVQRQPERLESPVRKWLTYIALVITAGAMIGDAVTFLAYLLRGDLDTRFVLKVLTVLVIAGGVFGYYLDSLNRARMSVARNRLFTIGAIAFVCFGVIVGFLAIGSPARQRTVSQDERRLYDLSSVARGLHATWSARGQKDWTLPATIEDVRHLDAGVLARTADPVSGRTYGYTPLHGTDYRLCATFSRANPPDTPDQWRHPAGSACFTLDARDNVKSVRPQ